MGEHFLYNDVVVLVFAKAPVQGRVNTRLIPSLGVNKATNLHEILTIDRIRALSDARLCQLQLWCTPDTGHNLFIKCNQNYGVALYQQMGSDLGERMSNAVQNSLVGNKAVILVGTDAPALNTGHIKIAIEKLKKEYDVVIVPAEDGGYVLIGMRQHSADVFKSVDWGTGKVLQQTLSNLKSTNLRYCLLETLWDIDCYEDYERYLALSGAD